MPLTIRTMVAFVEDQTATRNVSGPILRKVAVGAVVNNPYAGRYVDDLDELIDGSVEIGRVIAGRAVELMAPFAAESYAKGAIVGTAGEVEHAEAVLTTRFGDTLRAAVGGGKAWISHSAKQAVAGASIDIPLAHKDALFVRSHYDLMTLSVPGAPRPNEIVIFCCLANRGRLSHRIGGLRAEDITLHDGLR